MLILLLLTFFTRRNLVLVLRVTLLILNLISTLSAILFVEQLTSLLILLTLVPFVNLESEWIVYLPGLFNFAVYLITPLVALYMLEN